MTVHAIRGTTDSGSWTDEQLLATFNHGFEVGRAEGAREALDATEPEGRIGRFIDRLQERFEFLR
ncbi:hypothetical protein OG558_19750 [Kribbella sp. NBC_01510]|uniref:hypothetical protein n=1 Tax=Kribbella sp. NBC_01510 TaxID=2903581 RepID=UPI003870C456